MTKAHAAIFAAFCLLASPNAALASDVTLTSPDGAVTVSGTLLGFDGEFYRVDTEYGVLTLDGTAVTCAGEDCPDLANFVAEARFSGARRMGDVLMPALVEAFAIRNGYVLERRAEGDGAFTYLLRETAEGRVLGRLSFHLTSSEEGFADLVAEQADVVMSLREVTAEEVRIAHAAGMGDLSDADRARIVALDAVVPLVSIGNPTRDIRLEDLSRVMAGEITDWADLGGDPAPLTLHLTEASHGLSRVVARRLPDPVEVTAPGVVRHATAAALADAVAADPHALGLGSYTGAGNAVPLTLLGPCGFTAEATEGTLKAEDYPLTAPLFLYTPARRLPRLVREFLAYATSPAAQPVVRRAGYVDQFPQAIPLAQQGRRFVNAIARAGEETTLADLQRMVGALDGRSRLTLTFRFENGSSALDAQSQSNVALLAGALERGVFDGRELLFVGFSDGDGPAPINARLSATRARAVRDAVRAAANTLDPARLTLRTEAFGEAMPMACDDSEWGRQVNRRVEVWIDGAPR